MSPGCLNCYAEARDRRHLVERVSHWGKGQPRRRVKTFEAEAKAMDRQGAGSRERLRVFPSLCDWLDPEVPVELLADFLRVIYETPNLEWLLLTKRPEMWGKRLVQVCQLHACDGAYRETAEARAYHDMISPWETRQAAPSNVWLGVSVEDQQRADERIPELLKIPAAIRFVSLEPLLGPVNLTVPRRQEARGSRGEDLSPKRLPFPPMDWVIVGGETGPGARPCNVGWIRDVVRQCQAAEVACFVKQLGSNCVSPDDDCHCPMADIGDRDVLWKADFKDRAGADMAEWPEDLRVREYPEEAAR